MKMVCIKKGAWTTHQGPSKWPTQEPCPNFGEIVEVIESKPHPVAGLLLRLREYALRADGDARWFQAERFKPIQHDEHKACDSSFLDLFKKAKA